MLQYRRPSNQSAIEVEHGRVITLHRFILMQLGIHAQKASLVLHYLCKNGLQLMLGPLRHVYGEHCSPKYTLVFIMLRSNCLCLKLLVDWCDE